MIVYSTLNFTFLQTKSLLINVKNTI